MTIKGLANESHSSWKWTDNYIIIAKTNIILVSIQPEVDHRDNLCPSWTTWEPFMCLKTEFALPTEATVTGAIGKI